MDRHAVPPVISNGHWCANSKFMPDLSQTTLLRAKKKKEKKEKEEEKSLDIYAVSPVISNGHCCVRIQNSCLTYLKYTLLNWLQVVQMIGAKNT